MDKFIKMQYMDTINKLEGREHLVSVIAYKAAPTVKGLKPSSLMTFSKRNRNRLDLWNRFKDEVSGELKLEYFEVREKEESVTVLFYKKKVLKRLLANRERLNFIKKLGYKETMTLEEKLQLLKERFAENCPHEIGIFLGYPVEDVEGFIKHRGEKSLMRRYWKVYENPGRAQNLFKIYDRAKTSIARSVVNLGYYREASLGTR